MSFGHFHITFCLNKLVCCSHCLAKSHSNYQCPVVHNPIVSQNLVLRPIPLHKQNYSRSSLLKKNIHHWRMGKWKKIAARFLYLLRQRLLRTTTSPKTQASCPLFLFFLGILLQTVRKTQNIKLHSITFFCRRNIILCRQIIRSFRYLFILPLILLVLLPWEYLQCLIHLQYP